jgi:molybdopterin molybdotransferase
MLDPETAWARLLPFLEPRLTEVVDRRRAAGRRLAAPVHATTDLPPCDLAALDGFALAGEATTASGYPIAGTRFAGDPLDGLLTPGQAMRIMTGSAVPAGADRVVGVEETACEDDRMRLTAEVLPGAAIRRQGEIVRSGDRILGAGAPVTPAALALLASQGIATVEIHRPPRLALLLTGNEIVPPEAKPEPGQLRDSHSDFLLAELVRLGLQVRSLGIARDEPKLLAERVREGVENADVLLCCGGVSMGEADFLAPVLAQSGFETLFHGVAIQPGKPLLAARRAAEGESRLVFGLPGNPASVMVAWWLFVRPALRRLMGEPEEFWSTARTGTLGAPLAAGKRRDRFVPARWRQEGMRTIVAPIPPKGSHDLLAFGHATALLRVRAGAPAAAAGGACEWLPIYG